jgi:hypothetical protein
MNINRKLGVAVVAALTTGLAACGGGGYDDGGNPTPPARQAPTIVGLANQTLPQDTSTPVLTFQVSDTDSGANAVTVTATSSDATIIIRAVDPDGLFAQQMIGVTVNGVFVSFTMRVMDTFGDAENAEPRSLRGFTFTQDADDNPNAFDPLLQ